MPYRTRIEGNMALERSKHGKPLSGAAGQNGRYADFAYEQSGGLQINEIQ